MDFALQSKQDSDGKVHIQVIIGPDIPGNGLLQNEHIRGDEFQDLAKMVVVCLLLQEAERHPWMEQWAEEELPLACTIEFASQDNLDILTI